MVLLFCCLSYQVEDSRADFVNDPNAGFFQVDFQNSIVGLGNNAPPFINNINFDHTAGTATPSAAGAYVTTTEIRPSSFVDYREVRLTGSIANALDALVEIDACDGSATPIAGPFTPVGGIVDISGLGLPNCIQVKVLFNNTPTLSEIEVTWIPLPVMILNLLGDETDLVGANHCYDLEFSNSFVDNDDIVIWVPLPTGLTDAYSQTYDPSFVSATRGGEFTAAGTTVNGIAVPANSIYWDLGFKKRGTATTLKFLCRYSKWN